MSKAFHSLCAWIFNAAADENAAYIRQQAEREKERERERKTGVVKLSGVLVVSETKCLKLTLSERNSSPL